MFNFNLFFEPIVTKIPLRNNNDGKNVAARYIFSSVCIQKLKDKQIKHMHSAHSSLSHCIHKNYFLYERRHDNQIACSTYYRWIMNYLNLRSALCVHTFVCVCCASLCAMSASAHFSLSFSFSCCLIQYFVLFVVVVVAFSLILQTHHFSCAYIVFVADYNLWNECN